MTRAQARTDWSCPDARLVLGADADRDSWLEARREGIGGSDVSAITGLSPYSSAYQVWLDKSGLGEEREQTMAMRMGNLLEPIVVQLFEEEQGITTRRAGLMRSKDNPFMQVSVDRLTADGGVLECKTSTGWLSHEWADGQVPDHAELQVQHGLAVTGRSHAWVVGLLDGRDLFVRRVDRDEALIAELVEIERRFWVDHVIAGEDPPVTRVDVEFLKTRFSSADPDTAAVGDGEELSSIRAEYEQARDQIKHWEGVKSDAAARVMMLAGEADQLQDEAGRTWFTVKQNGRFSVSRFVKDHPEVADQFMVPTEELDAKKLAENHPQLHAEYRARVLRTPKMKDDE